MKKFISNYRFWVLAALTLVAVVGLVSEPTAQAMGPWLVTMVVSKTIGVLSALVGVRLFIYWAKRGEIDCLTDLIGEE